ncbi:MAG: outer membrane lipoprotein carrier protein LolA [Pseudomonadales bacterium]|nr:outer membrane lipoprotein carrier protein LolA [Pseudomonadales bacterium]
MSKFKPLYLAFLLCLSLPCLSADDSSEATPVLERIQTILQTPAIMRGEFSQQKKLRILKKPLQSEGDFIIARGQGIIWNVLKPVQSQMIIGHDSIYFSEQMSGNAERSMSYIAKILNAILAGELKHLQQQFIISDSTIDNQQQWQLTLTPKSLLMRKALASIELQGSQVIDSIQLNENSGDYTLIQLQNIIIENVISDDIYQQFLTAVNPEDKTQKP